MTGKEARNIRHELFLTQKEMADKIGVSRQAIIRYENKGKIPESIENLYKLINKYEVQ